MPTSLPPHVRCSVLQCVAVCCNSWQCVAASHRCMPASLPPHVHCSVLQCAAVCCNALQCVAVSYRCMSLSLLMGVTLSLSRNLSHTHISLTHTNAYRVEVEANSRVVIAFEIVDANQLLQCVAVCGSVLQCVVVCCSVLQCAAACCSVLQCVAVCCSVNS